MSRFLTLFALLVSLFAGWSAAAEADEAYSRFRKGARDLATMSEVLPMMADAEKRDVIRDAVTQAEKPPREELVSLLGHPHLAVRLGALELLEEMAGGDFSFNPWLPGGEAGNEAALARWRAWTGEPAGDRAKRGVFSEEQRLAYLRDLLDDDADKGARARRMLQAEGLPAVGFLEDYLTKTPALPPGSRARIREAQYQIVLARYLGDQAAMTARQLAFGSRDQLLSALAAARAAGPYAVPILRDFIEHPDPLVRETAIDILLLSAGDPAVPLVAPLLENEADVNVIHGALRRLKEIRTGASEKLVARFLTHPDEDVLVSAIQTSLTLSGDNDRYSSGRDKERKNPEADPAVLACLKDPRWRVRANALEYISKRKLSSAKDECLRLLGDDDDFVRFAAIKALAAIGDPDVLPRFKELAVANPDLIGPVVAGYAAMDKAPDEELLDLVDAAPPEQRLAAVRAAAGVSALSPLLARYADDPDADVACAALKAIASDEDKLKKVALATAVLLALRSGDEAKAGAILESIDLPNTTGRGRIDPALLQLIRNAGPAETTALDPLYDAFVRTGAEAGGRPAEPAVREIPGALGEIISEIEKRNSAGTPPELRFRAALHLARAGRAAGFATLRELLPGLTTARKTEVGRGLDSVSSADAMPVLEILLRDPVPEVRSAAAEAALSNHRATALVGLVLGELAADGGALQPAEVYGYRFDYAVRENGRAFRPWCREVLGNEAAATPLVVLAGAAARHCADGAIIDALRARTKSADPLVRRQAWFALLGARPAGIGAAAAEIGADPEAFVRAALPDRVSRDSYAWVHRFSDTHIEKDATWESSSKKVRPDAAAMEALQRMAAADPSPLVRFEAGYALIKSGGTTDIDSLAALVPTLPKETAAPDRIGDWLEENAPRATPALRPLLAVANQSRIGPDKLKILRSRVNPEQVSGLLTFATLAGRPDGPETSGSTAPLLADDAAEAVERESLDVVFFYKPGCAECGVARRYFEALRADFPLLRIHERNILEPSGLVLNEALCSRFRVPATRSAMAPAVFAQAGFVIGPDISPASLGKLFGNTMDETQDDSWMALDKPRQAEAVAAVERRFESITLPIVLMGGLLDGINPCAFATIIFFLSYLQIARRTPREMLMVGAAFILAVFLAYFAAGLALHGLIEALSTRFAWLQRWMNGFFGILALIAAWLSLRDALRARAGRLDEMTLQLPGLLKDRIRGVIRSGARARRFVIAAFVAGVLISFLELACTGQVYAPIIYQIQKGRLDAVLWLAIYNIAFVTPLIVIFLLAYGGLRSETLIAFQKKHTFAVKIGLALLFLVLAAVILLGPKLLH